MKQADPEAVTSAEASTEEFIDLVDTRLCAMVLRRHVAPIFSAIYHDYQLFYGRTIRGEWKEPNFSMTAGYCFNIGGQLGRYFIHGDGIDFDAAKHAEKLAFFKRLVAAKRSARAFLNVGRMLRPPKMLSEVPTLTAQIWYKKQLVTLPAVLCSAWRSAKGEVALVFVNCDTKPITFRWHADTVEYGFPAGTKVSRYDLTPEGRNLLGSRASGVWQQADSLPGHGVRVVLLKAEG